ncbi:hypothetical protein ACLOJK_011264 [Asimina triloba]
MDTTVKKANKSKSKVVDSSLALKKEAKFLGKGDAELKLLLLPRRGGISKRPKNERLKVQWNDKHGKKLAQVLEFEARLTTTCSGIAWASSSSYLLEESHPPKFAGFINSETLMSFNDESESEDDEGFDSWPSHMLASEFSVDGGIEDLNSERPQALLLWVPSFISKSLALNV